MAGGGRTCRLSETSGMPFRPFAEVAWPLHPVCRRRGGAVLSPARRLAIGGSGVSRRVSQARRIASSPASTVRKTGASGWELRTVTLRRNQNPVSSGWETGGIGCSARFPQTTQSTWFSAAMASQSPETAWFRLQARREGVFTPGDRVRFSMVRVAMSSGRRD